MASAQGKTVIVTGAAGGLGKAIATAFLAAGANVVICDVNPERIASADAEWAQSYPDKFLTQQTDVTDEAAVQKLVDAAVAKFGRLDVLVNNGMSPSSSHCPFAFCLADHVTGEQGIALGVPPKAFHTVQRRHI
jgi:NAD(P)-dependent dehydrogenase (short-subunit alcohol dehydrogenase family)